MRTIAFALATLLGAAAPAVLAENDDAFRPNNSLAPAPCPYNSGCEGFYLGPDNVWRPLESIPADRQTLRERRQYERDLQRPQREYRDYRDYRYDDRYYDNRYYGGRYGYPDANMECWNPRARHFERVRPGERQDDLDFSRCRSLRGWR